VKGRSPELTKKKSPKKRARRWGKLPPKRQIYFCLILDRSLRGNLEKKLKKHASTWLRRGGESPPSGEETGKLKGGQAVEVGLGVMTKTEVKLRRKGLPNTMRGFDSSSGEKAKVGNIRN